MDKNNNGNVIKSGISFINARRFKKNARMDITKNIKGRISRIGFTSII